MGIGCLLEGGGLLDVVLFERIRSAGTLIEKEFVFWYLEEVVIEERFLTGVCIV